MVTHEVEALEVAGMASRVLKALARRAGRGELEALEALYALQTDLQYALAAGVAGYREGPAEASWRDIGRIFGMAGPSAHERWAHATPAWAHPAKCQCDSPGVCRFWGPVYQGEVI